MTQQAARRRPPPAHKYATAVAASMQNDPRVISLGCLQHANPSHAEIQLMLKKYRERLPRSVRVFALIKNQEGPTPVPHITKSILPEYEYRP